MIEQATWQLSPRTTIAPGDCVRFGGGGTEWYSSADRQWHRLPLRGLYIVERICRIRGKRIFLDVVELCDGQRGRARFVFASGRTWRSQRTGFRHRPYKVRKVGVKAEIGKRKAESQRTKTRI